MTRKNSVIAGAALLIALTAGMAGWMSAKGRQPIEEPVLVAATSGVAETEGVVAPQPQPIEPAVQPAVVEVPAIRYVPAPVPKPAPARAATRVDRTAVSAEPVEPAEPANPRTEPVAPVEAVEPSEPAAPRYVEVRVPTGTVLGLRLNSTVTSENAELEDRVEAIVTRDVVADGRVAIASGTRVLGSVNDVVRGGKFKERARLGIRFHTLVLADGTRETLKTDAVVREGDSPARETAAKIGGGAVGGAIIGGIMGGKKGALLGGAAGAGAGTAAVVAGDRSVASIASGTPLSIRLDAPVTLTIERE